MATTENSPGMAVTPTTVTYSSEKLDQAIGEALAEGLSHEEIIERIKTVSELPEAAIVEAIRAVYSYWQKIDQRLELNSEDLKRWHIRLRLQLLQRSLADGSVPGLRCALSVLESLASLHGFENLKPAEIEKEIRVVLVPADQIDRADQLVH